MALLVLDEADRLLEMGFEDDLAAVRYLVITPAIVSIDGLRGRPGSGASPSYHPYAFEDDLAAVRRVAATTSFTCGYSPVHMHMHMPC